MGTKIVGLDVGSMTLRAVEVEGATKGRPTVLRYHEVALPAGAVKSGEVVEVNTVATALKQMWAAAGFSSRRVVLGMGNQRVLARELSLPKMSPSKIRESLPFQVQDMLPIPVSEALLDFYPISERAGDDGTVVNGLLIAAVKDAVLGNVNAVRLAGLSPMEVDLIPFALTRVQARSEPYDGTVAIIDVGATTTNVVVSIAGVPQFVRIIPSGGDDVTAALMARQGLSEAQAQQAKGALGLSGASAQPENRAIAEVIFGVTNELLVGLRNTIQYFDNTHEVANISRIVLSGGGARLDGFASALAEVSRLQVTTADPFADVSLSATASKDDAVGRESMTVALGLALGSAA